MVDYRGLNAQTRHDSYTLPLIEDMLQKQFRRRIFTVIGLKHGYHHMKHGYHRMPLANESRACTTMSTPLGPLQWKVMPMGVTNGNAACQRMLENLLEPVRDCADAVQIAVHPVTVRTDHQSLQSWHKEHMDTPSGQASRRARWHETLAKFDLTVVYVPGKDNTVADNLSRWAYPASKAMTDVSAHGDEAETAEAKNIIDLERMMEEDGAKCFVVMVAYAPLGRRVSKAVRVLAPEGAESDKHLFRELCLQDD